MQPLPETSNSKCSKEASNLTYENSESYTYETEENVNTYFIIPDENENAEPSQTELLELLKQWNLLNLFNHFSEQNITVKHLKRMSFRQMDKLLIDFPAGTKIDFEYELINFQRQLGITINCAKEEDNRSITTVSSFLSNCTAPISPASNTSTSKGNHMSTSNNDYNLQNIINSRVEGSMIIAYYKQHKELKDENRRMLADLVVDYFIDRKIQLTTDICNQIAAEIKIMFPSEEEIYYYQKRHNNAPVGRLYTKYHNRKNKFKNSGLQYGCAKTPIIPNNISTFTNKRPIAEISNADDYVRALKYQILSPEEIINNWQGSISIRLDQISKSKSTKEIMEAWPMYKNVDGYKLVIQY